LMRLSFGCPGALLEEAAKRMCNAINNHWKIQTR
jgi:hypothetical protein